MKANKEEQSRGFGEKIRRKRISIPRFLIQTVSFFLIFGGLFGIAATHLILPIIAPFGSPYTTVGGAWAFLEITVTAGLFPALAIAVIALSSLLVGRLFCAWICPLGFIYEVESFFGRKVNVSKYTNKALYKLSLVLAGLFLFIGVSIGYREAIGKSIRGMFGKMAREPSSIIDPLSTVFSMLFWFFYLEKYPRELADLATIPAVFWFRVTFLIVSFVLSFYVTRGYCRYLCPLGGVMGVASQYGFLTVYRDPRKCEKGCRECEKVCPMGIKLRDYEGRVEDPLCILCGKCIEACPEGAFSLDFH